jgi:hypothetical protein
LLDKERGNALVYASGAIGRGGPGAGPQPLATGKLTSAQLCRLITSTLKMGEPAPGEPPPPSVQLPLYEGRINTIFEKFAPIHIANRNLVTKGFV